MIIAINDVSFKILFENKTDACHALMDFGNLCLKLQKEEISQVSVPEGIITSPEIHKNILLAENCTLIDVLKEIRNLDNELFRFLISKLTSTEYANYEERPLKILNILSKHCGHYMNDFFISLISHESFKLPLIHAYSEHQECISLKNLSLPEHLYLYWEELGFREYELNPKHGKKEYFRANGMKVGIAPETDSLGQFLLNHVIQYQGKLISVDTEHGNRIFEFRQTIDNTYHAFEQTNLSKKEKERILFIWKCEQN